jgi:hypothetical protein
MKIAKIEDIESIHVHWSESNLINDELGCNEDSDIEKQVDPIKFDDLISRAAKEVGGGYDKTMLSVKLKDGSDWCKECKFYLSSGDSGLMNLLNKGE